MTQPDGLLSADAVLDRISQRLAHRSTGIVTAETVHRLVAESYVALLRTSAVKQHVPSLTEHFALERLTAVAQASGATVKAVPEVLFVCEQNAGRSQIAAALLDRIAIGRVHVRSAGSHPAGDLHPETRRLLEQVGADVSAAFPKPLTDDVVRAADVVITMGCGDACPVYPGKRYEDWDVADPDGADDARLAAIHDDLDGRVHALLADLTDTEPR
jgi:protein-tyrosine-phosphatase